MKVPPGEEAVFCSLLFSIGLVLMLILVIWMWPEVLNSHHRAPHE